MKLLKVACPRDGALENLSCSMSSVPFRAWSLLGRHRIRGKSNRHQLGSSAHKSDRNSFRNCHKSEDPCCCSTGCIPLALAPEKPSISPIEICFWYLRSLSFVCLMQREQSCWVLRKVYPQLWQKPVGRVYSIAGRPLGTADTSQWFNSDWMSASHLVIAIWPCCQVACGCATLQTL